MGGGKGKKKQQKKKFQKLGDQGTSFASNDQLNVDQNEVVTSSLSNDFDSQIEVVTNPHEADSLKVERENGTFEQKVPSKKQQKKKLRAQKKLQQLGEASSNAANLSNEADLTTVRRVEQAGDTSALGLEIEEPVQPPESSYNELILFDDATLLARECRLRLNLRHVSLDTIRVTEAIMELYPHSANSLQRIIDLFKKQLASEESAISDQDDEVNIATREIFDDISAMDDTSDLEANDDDVNIAAKEGFGDISVTYGSSDLAAKDDDSNLAAKEDFVDIAAEADDSDLAAEEMADTDEEAEELILWKGTNET